MTVTLADVEAAARRLAGHLPRTPAEEAPRLSEAVGCTVFLKLETQHRTGAFKERGALNKLLSLSPEERAAGVVAMSAGNHAQAVACHATRLAIRSTIVMPAFTPFTKVERTEALGATVVLKGETLSDAEAFAHELAAREGCLFVHPYDDPLIIAGQGTAGLEFIEQEPEVDTLVVPVGGGGLIGGIAVAAKALRPDITIVGVECAFYPSMRQALAGEPVRCSGSTIAEGIAVKAPGRHTLEIARRLVDDILLVDEVALEQAVYQLSTIQKLVAEGAGAAGLAAVMSEPARFAGRRVGIVVSGGNIDARILSQVLVRGLVREGRVVRLRIGLADVPGALATVTRLIADVGANVVEVHHQRLFQDVPVKMAEIDVILETRGTRHLAQIMDTLVTAGFPTELMSDVS